MILSKCCTQYASKFGKLSSGHRTGKGQFSFQSQRKVMPKNAQTTAQLHSSYMLVMLKILQARLQQYMNCELPDVQAGFRKGRGTRDQIANICWIIEKAREFPKNIYFCFIDYAKAFGCMDHNKLWKILKEMGISDHLTRLLRNLYAGQEGTVRTGHGTTDWFQIGKGVRQDRKSTRLNSSHHRISYAVFCLKKKKKSGTGKSEKEHKERRSMWRTEAERQ